MTDTPETIYLIPGETWDSPEGLCWCDSPAPGAGMDPDDAVAYIRADKHEMVEAHLAAVKHLCERLQDCANRYYLDQGDHGHMEAIMRDYHSIMRGDGTAQASDSPVRQLTECDWCGEEFPDDLLQNETQSGDAICDHCADEERRNTYGGPA